MTTRTEVEEYKLTYIDILSCNKNYTDKNKEMKVQKKENQNNVTGWIRGNCKS